MDLGQLLDTTIWGNSLRQWLIAVSVGIGTAFLLRIVIKFVIARLRKVARTTETPWDDILLQVLRSTLAALYILVAAFIAASMVTLPDPLYELIRKTLGVLFIVQCGVWTMTGVRGWISDYRARQVGTHPGAVTTMSAVGFMAQIAIWSIVLLLSLANVGINVTALMTTLGVGGIAVALALQSVLGDLFASLSIVFDKPFLIGDFINVDGLVGTIEHVGLRSTRVRSLSGEQLVFSNTDLLKSRIANFGKLRERRILFTIDVTYDTPLAQLRAIPDMLREAVTSQEHTRFDRAHFKAHGESALTFEVVYFVLGPDYKLFMDIQQAINLRLHEGFSAAGIQFAFPTRTVHLAGREAAAVGAG